MNLVHILLEPLGVDTFTSSRKSSVRERLGRAYFDVFIFLNAAFFFFCCCYISTMVAYDVEADLLCNF